MPKQRVKRHAVTQPLEESYRFIPLTKSMNAIVDVEDYERLSRWNWRAQPGHKTFYAVRSEYIGDRRTKNVLMHREIMNCFDGFKVDHRSGNGLDNRKTNLRQCSDIQNMCHTTPHRDGSTKFKGVRCRKGKYQARIHLDKTTYYLGQFANAEQAAKAYDKAAKKFHGEFAFLNFP